MMLFSYLDLDFASSLLIFIVSDKSECCILSLVSLCCVGVVSSFFLDHLFSIPYNITINQNTTQIVNGKNSFQIILT